MNQYDFHKALQFEQPTLVCMRGVPGSGKTIRANELLAKWGDRTVVHSTDSYCMVDGEYRYNPNAAGYYHARNLEAAFESMVAGKQIIIIDNTNVKAKHFFPYYDFGKMAGYRLLVLEAPGMNLDAKILAERNTHGVTVKVIKEMLRQFEPERIFLKRLEELWEEKQQARTEPAASITG